MALANQRFAPEQEACLRRARRPFRTERRSLKQIPKLSIVIVNYCQWHETAALCGQLLRTPQGRQGALEVVVVDNHSPRHRLTGKLRRWPGVSLRRWKRNRGFARAVNEGCRLSRGHWLLLLNPDVTLHDGFVEGIMHLIDTLPDRDAKAGIIGFHLRNPDGSRQLSSGLFPTLSGTLGGLFLPRAERKYQQPVGDSATRVPWVTGCCFLLRRACLEQLGGFDEDYFLYYEDVDFCLRAQSIGWTVWYEPGVCATHHRPLHSRKVTTPLRVFTRHALMTYGAKHWHKWQFQLLTGIVRTEAWLKRQWAHCRGDHAAAQHFSALSAISRDMAHGRQVSARKRLDWVVHREELERAH
jgi:GT2 family glycosyltransferase